jgi:hypothetical protein
MCSTSLSQTCESFLFDDCLNASTHIDVRGFVFLASICMQPSWAIRFLKRCSRALWTSKPSNDLFPPKAESAMDPDPPHRLFDIRNFSRTSLVAARAARMFAANSFSRPSSRTPAMSDRMDLNAQIFHIDTWWLLFRALKRVTFQPLVMHQAWLYGAAS